MWYPSFSNAKIMNADLKYCIMLIYFHFPNYNTKSKSFRLNKTNTINNNGNIN